MVYHRYGNPRCPYYYSTGDHWQTELIRCYVRDPKTRVFTAVGWYCDYCHLAWVDGEEKLEKAQSRFKVGLTSADPGQHHD